MSVLVLKQTSGGPVCVCLKQLRLLQTRQCNTNATSDKRLRRSDSKHEKYRGWVIEEEHGGSTLSKAQTLPSD